MACRTCCCWLQHWSGSTEQTLSPNFQLREVLWRGRYWKRQWNAVFMWRLWWYYIERYIYINVYIYKYGCKRTHAEWISDQSACDHLRYLSIVDAWATQLCKNGSYPPVRVKATNLPSYHLAAVKYTATRNLRSEELCLNYLQMWFQPIWKILVKLDHLKNII